MAHHPLAVRRQHRLSSSPPSAPSSWVETLEGFLANARSNALTEPLLIHVSRTFPDLVSQLLVVDFRNQPVSAQQLADLIWSKGPGAYKVVDKVTRGSTLLETPGLQRTKEASSNTGLILVGLAAGGLLVWGVTR